MAQVCGPILWPRLCGCGIAWGIVLATLWGGFVCGLMGSGGTGEGPALLLDDSAGKTIIPCIFMHICTTCDFIHLRLVLRKRMF